MSGRPPLYNCSEVTLDIFQDSLRVLEVRHLTGFNTCTSVQDALQLFSQNDDNIAFTISGHSLSFIQLYQEIVDKSNSPLHLACALGEPNQVKALCAFNPIDVCNKNGDTPLHVACRRGHAGICEYLVSQMICECDRYLNFVKPALGSNFVALAYVSSLFHELPSKILVEHFCEVLIQGCVGEQLTTPVRPELLKQRMDEIKVFVMFCNTFPSLFTLNDANELPLHVALKSSQQLCLRSILNIPDIMFIFDANTLGSIRNVPDSFVFDVSTINRIVHVHQSVRFLIRTNIGSHFSSECDQCIHEYRNLLHDVNGLQYGKIMNSGLDVQLQNYNGLLPVETFYFYYKEVSAVVEYLKRYSAFPLHYLIEHYFLALLLVSQNVDSSNLVNEAWSQYFRQRDASGNLPLHLLCENYNGDNNVFLELFAQCEVNSKNYLKTLPFEIAFDNGNYKTCTWLMWKKQCDVYLYASNSNKECCMAIKAVMKHTDHDVNPSSVIAGDTILHVLLRCGSEKIITSFIQVEDITENKVNSRQESPLHIACQLGHSYDVCELLTKGNVVQQDINGNTPLDLLVEHHPHRYDLMVLLMNSPSFPSNYCSRKTEIMIAQQFLKFGKSALILFRGSNSILCHALELGDIETVRFLKYHCSDLFSEFISVKNHLGELPFHVCGRKRNKEGLTLVYDNVDLNTLSESGDSVLVLACLHSTGSEKDLEFLRYLVEDLKCNPHISNVHGRTPLHLACRQGSFKLVKYLLNDAKVDPNTKDKTNCTPLMLTSHYEHDIIRELIQAGAETSHLYAAYKDFFVKYSKDNPPPTPLNIIVVGKPSSGKTTIVKALKSEGSCDMVLTEEYTVGIIPSSYDSEYFGSTAWYDLAGQSEYYASHEAVLYTLMSSSSPLILLLVDCRMKQEFIHQDILYWLHFLKSQISPKQANIKPHVAIVFSFADMMSQQVVEEKITCCKMCMAPFFQKSNFKFVQIAALDCRFPNSDEVNSIRQQILASAKEIRVVLPINFLLHCFYAFLLHKFHDRPTVTMQNVIDLQEEWISLDIDLDEEEDCESGSDASSSGEFLDYEEDLMLREESVDDLLHKNEYFLKLSKKLHKTGHIILVENHITIRKSWLIINKDILLHEIHGTLFAPPHLKQHYENLSTSTGVVLSSTIASIFSNYDVTMLVGLLTHLEYCQEIKDESILNLLSSDSSYDRNNEYYYFPGLVRIEKPEGVWETPSKQYNQCCWLLQVTDAHTFFTPRFVQVLLLRVAFSYPFAVKGRRIGFPNLTLCHACCVWRNGIFWRSDIGIECLFEITEEFQAVVLMFRSSVCELSSDNVASFSYLRTSLINTILSTAQELCPTLNVSEYFCHPDDIQYPIKLCQDMALYSIESIAKTICQKSKLVLCENPKYPSIPLDELVNFEPLMCFCSNRLFDDLFKDQIISADDLKSISEVCKRSQFGASYSFILRRKGSSSYQSDIAMDIEEVIKSWTKKLSYKTLKLLISSFSIFGNRDPRELGECATISESMLSTHIPPEACALPENVASPTIGKLTLLKWVAKDGQVQKLEIIKSVCSEWKKVGDLIDLTIYRLEAIEKNGQGKVETCCRDVFCDWLKQEEGRYSVTWNGLRELLEDMKFSAIVKKLDDFLLCMEETKQ